DPGGRPRRTAGVRHRAPGDQVGEGAVRLWLALAPIPATLVGAVTAHAQGVSPGTFLPNLAALVIGGVGFLWLTRRRDAAALPRRRPRSHAVRCHRCSARLDATDARRSPLGAWWSSCCC